MAPNIVMKTYTKLYLTSIHQMVSTRWCYAWCCHSIEYNRLERIIRMCFSFFCPFYSGSDNSAIYFLYFNIFKFFWQVSYNSWFIELGSESITACTCYILFLESFITFFLFWWKLRCGDTS